MRIRSRSSSSLGSEHFTHREFNWNPFPLSGNYCQCYACSFKWVLHTLCTKSNLLLTNEQTNAAAVTACAWQFDNIHTLIMENK